MRGSVEVAHWAHNPKVGGSNPPPATTNKDKGDRDMKTAMELLIDRLNNVKPTEFCSIETIRGWADYLLAQEQDQIEIAFYDGENFSADYFDPDRPDVPTEKNYYERMYGLGVVEERAEPVKGIDLTKINPMDLAFTPEQLEQLGKI